MTYCTRHLRKCSLYPDQKGYKGHLLCSAYNYGKCITSYIIRARPCKSSDVISIRIYAEYFRLDFRISNWISDWISDWISGFLPTVYEISFVADPSVQTHDHKKSPFTSLLWGSLRLATITYTIRMVAPLYKTYSVMPYIMA